MLFLFQKEYEEKKKAEGKRSRDDKNAVLDMLFKAFDKHQYYNIKDLVLITKQPVVSELRIMFSYITKNVAFFPAKERNISREGSTYLKSKKLQEHDCYFNNADIICLSFFTNLIIIMFQGYLKEILKEVCNHNMKNPHKNMWELKPEYRHYKTEETPDTGAGTSSST